MGGGGGISGLGSIAGDAVGLLTGTGGMDRGYKAQKQGAAQAQSTVKQTYQDQLADLAPWREAGISALNQFSDPNFGKNMEMDTGYRFRLQEGQKALNAAGAAKGMNLSGAAIKAAARYNQDFATNEYNNAYNRQAGRLQSLMGVGQDANNAQIGVRGNFGQQMSGLQTGLANAKAAKEVGKGQAVSGLIQQGMQGAAMAFCDENLKTDIREIPQEELKELAQNLNSYFFKYKDESHGKGEYLGVMAQDLQKSKLGKWLVKENEQGHLTVDLQKTLMIFLATLPLREAA
jgi:hypothetical protein